MAEKNKNVVITVKSRKKMVMARAGDITLPKIVGMAFGDGGTGGDGAVLPPADDQVELRNELYRKEISGHIFPSDTSCRYECTLEETELAGKSISELGLYDEAGDIVCIKTFTAKGKDDDMEMTFTVDDIF